MKRLCGLTISLLILLAPAIMAEENITPLPIGSSAPEFALPGVDGKTYSLDNFKQAKILAIIFTCNHCPTAQAYEERIIQMVKDYTPKDVAFVAISPNDPLSVRLDELGYSDLGDSLEDMKIRAKDKKYNFPYLYDGETQVISKKYGPTATPHIFLFDKERKLKYRGRIDNNERDPKKVTVRNAKIALDAMLSGKPVDQETSKPMGCSIKWSSKRDWVVKGKAAWAKEPVEMKPIGVDGIKKLVANQTEKYRLINVWATWCGPCVIEFPELITVNRMYRKRHFEFVTVNVDGPDSEEAKILKFLKEQQASGVNYYFNSTEQEAFIEALDPEWQANLPFTILVKPGGGIVYRHSGIIDPLELKQEIVERIGRTYASKK